MLEMAVEEDWREPKDTRDKGLNKMDIYEGDQLLDKILPFHSMGNFCLLLGT